MNEAKAQARFGKWLRENNYNQTCAWELKFALTGRTISFRSFQPQQIPSLLQAKKGCVYKKLSDADPTLKPFDALQICNAEAFVVLVWWTPRKRMMAYWIDVEVFMEIMEASRDITASISEITASKVAKQIISL